MIEDPGIGMTNNGHGISGTAQQMLAYKHEEEPGLAPSMRLIGP